MTVRPYDTIVVAMKERRFEDAEHAATHLVKQEPLNPQGWVFLAEALMQQGFIETAHKVFERASLLDPEADWVEPVHAWLSVLKDSVPRFDIEALMTLPTVTVTAVIVAKDDGHALKRCIASLHEAVDEIIIVDRSSTDATRATIAIANDAQMNLRVLDYTSEQDEVVAMNGSLQFVTSDWVIFVHASDCLFRQDQSAIREVASLYSRVSPPVILSVGQEPITPYVGSRITYKEDRMFPIGHGFRFWGDAHPQIGDDRGPFEDQVIRRSVRIRFGSQEDDLLTQMQQLLAEAKGNLLKSKALFATYRGSATSDRQILTWKADERLLEIAKYDEGDFG